MSLAPLLDAAPAIPVHAFAAMAAFALGIVQFAAPKGTLPHRTVGWIWVGLMATVAASSFWIHEIRLLGPWSPIHLLSIFTLIMLPIAVWRARRHRVADHRRIMTMTFVAHWSLPGCSHCFRGGSCMRWFSANRAMPGKALRMRRFQGLKMPAPRALPEDPADPGKSMKKRAEKHLSSPLRGGYRTPDALYDSQLRTDRIPLCLTLKITSPASRRSPPIFVPFPSSTR